MNCSVFKTGKQDTSQQPYLMIMSSNPTNELQESKEEASVAIFEDHERSHLESLLLAHV